mgnify:FL=1
MNDVILPFRVKFGIREEYAIEYLEQIQEQYVSLTGLQPESVKRGRGHRKTEEQRFYEKLREYIGRLRKYAEHIKICGEDRNSYSKTDNGATFMRMKRDYRAMTNCFRGTTFSLESVTNISLFLMGSNMLRM